MASNYDWLIYPAAIAGGAGLLYLLLKPKAEPERPPVVTPSGGTPGPATVAAVSTQFDAMRDRFYAGDLTAAQAAIEASRLTSSLESLYNRGVGDRTAIANLAAEIDRFLRGLSETVPV